MKRIKILSVGVLAGILAFCIFMAFPEIASHNNSVKEAEHIQQLIDDESEDMGFSHESWETLHQENEDFKGYLRFESGLIETPIVQGKDNDEYLRKSFEGNYDTQGVPFMEAMCSTYSANITIYGHNVYYDSTAKFSPLEKLTDDKNVEDNRFVLFYLNEECRKYEVIAVLYITSEETEEMNYAQPSFVTAKQKGEWIQFMMRKNLIHAETEPSPFDNFLTLQTCRKWNDNEHLLVICREVQRDSY